MLDLGNLAPVPMFLFSTSSLSPNKNLVGSAVIADVTGQAMSSLPLNQHDSLGSRGWGACVTWLIHTELRLRHIVDS